MQDRLVKGPSQRTERRPVRAGHRQQRDVLAGGREPDIGIQHREQPAARAGGLPPERDPGRLLGPGELADLDPDQLGQADRAHARKCACLPAVGILGRGDQRTALGQLCQPFAGHGEADLEEYLITNEHPCIPPS